MCSAELQHPSVQCWSDRDTMSTIYCSGPQGRAHHSGVQRLCLYQQYQTLGEVRVCFPVLLRECMKVRNHSINSERCNYTQMLPHRKSLVYLDKGHVQFTRWCVLHIHQAFLHDLVKISWYRTPYTTPVSSVMTRRGTHFHLITVSFLQWFWDSG